MLNFFFSLRLPGNALLANILLLSILLSVTTAAFDAHAQQQRASSQGTTPHVRRAPALPAGALATSPTAVKSLGKGQRESSAPPAALDVRRVQIQRQMLHTARRPLGPATTTQRPTIELRLSEIAGAAAQTQDDDSNLWWYAAGGAALGLAAGAAAVLLSGSGDDGSGSNLPLPPERP